MFGFQVRQKWFSMELLVSESPISNILASTVEQPNTSSVLLWVLHVDKIPPHIGISENQRYFSLKANGQDYNLPVEHVLDLINKKAIPSLCFELQRSKEPESLSSIFDVYSQTIPNAITCLNPIKEFLSISDVGKLSELLDVLYANGEIVKVIGFHLPEDFRGIRNYSTEAIHAHLKELSNE